MKKLFKMLNYVNNYVYSNKWKTVMNIVKHIPDSKIIKKEWADNYKNKSECYPLDLSDIKTWSTYDNLSCINLKFENINNELHCYVKIYNGRMFGGSRTELRFSAEIILPNNFILLIKDDIEVAFDIYCDNNYDEFLEQQRNKWISDFKKQLLS